MRRRTLLFVALLGCLLTLAVAASPGRDLKAQAADAAPAPVSLVIVYDSSYLAGYRGGKSFDRRKELFAALADFVRQGDRRTEYFVIHFDMSARLILDGTTSVEATLKTLSRLAALPHEGATSLHDACLFAIDTAARGRHKRRAMILLTDGEDTTSHKELRDVTESLADKQITLYAVNYQIPDVKAPALNDRGRYVLHTLASVSHGRVFQLERGKAGITFFQIIANDLNAHWPAKPQSSHR